MSERDAMSKSRRNIAAASPNEHTRKQGATPVAQKEVHCVVTGQTKSGKSIIASHGPMKPLTVGMIPGIEFYRIWGSDALVGLPCDGMPPAQPQYFPSTNGFRFGMFSLPPATSTQAPTEKAQQGSAAQAPTSAQLEE